MKSTPFLSKNENEDLNVDETLKLFIYSGLAKSDTKRFKQLQSLSPGVAEFMMLNIPSVANSLVHDLRIVDITIDQFQNDKLSEAPTFALPEDTD